MKNPDENIELIKFENLKKISNLIHFVTTRAGGVNSSPYKSLNLGLHTNDNPKLVLANRTLLAKRAGIETGKFLYASQVHSGDVKVIDSDAIKSGVLAVNPKTDAMITSLTGICLMVMVADCVPVLVFDPVKRVSAVIHAEWRGTMQHITTNTIRGMVEHFGCKPADLIAGIGPSIGPCCYEVGEEVEKLVMLNFGTSEGYLIKQQQSVKPNFDLWYANRKQLMDAGVKPVNIETSELCTKCNSELFFSYRASGSLTGRFAAGICIL